MKDVNLGFFLWLLAFICFVIAVKPPKTWTINLVALGLAFVALARLVAGVLLLATLALLSGCAPVAEYNKTVAARSDSLSGYTKDGGGGGTYTHRVEYR